MITQPFFSICIPAYNRSRFLPELLDSIERQSFKDFEVIIAEDFSPERVEIVNISKSYNEFFSLKLILNKENLGYDKNLRQLIVNASGKYILFMGNDDILADDSLGIAFSLLIRNPNVKCAIRGYSVFTNSILNIKYTVNYFSCTSIFSGSDRFSKGVRRFGVLSGLIFDSEIAKATITDQHDGALYYQTYLGIECLKKGPLLYINSVFSFSRDEISPDFGNSINELLFTPGKYTVEARFRMLSGVTKIFKSSLVGDFEIYAKEVEKDYAIYILPFFKDQVYSGFKKYYWLWNSVGGLGYNKYYIYHFIVWIAFLLKGYGMSSLEKIFRFVRGQIQK